MFCGCSSDYLAAGPNANVCEVCMGMPGTLPVINRRAVEKLIATGLALGCEVSPFTKFDRKNYFYPDLPKGYQISQYDLPLCRGGQLDIGDGRMIRITRVHLEEDTGKLGHGTEQLHSATRSFVDFNRSGVPLMEIVTEPDLHSAADAQAYATTLRTLLRHIGASDADMEKGQLRAEANVSVRRVGDPHLGVKSELKNINSFRFLVKAIDFEIERQIALLESGRTVVQETRGWSEPEQRTFSQRSKEQAEDYRYFPEPDLPPLVVGKDMIDAIAALLPELPAHRVDRFQSQYGLSEYDARLLVDDRATADYFEAVIAHGADPKQAANWVIGDAVPTVGESLTLPTPAALAELIRRVSSGEVNRDQGRVALTKAITEGRSPADVIDELGLRQISDANQLSDIVEAVLAEHSQAVVDFKAGKQQAMGFLMQQIKAKTGGSADMAAASKILRERLIR
jgi:aspartyl-tRNA(Asn)/glutamyl-tRNA(Gln) amidotransferase subunit B